MTVGALTAVASVVVVVKPSVHDIVFSSLPLATALITFGFGIALILVALLPWCNPSRLGRLPVLAVIAGVALNSAVWLLLMGREQHTI